MARNIYLKMKSLEQARELLFSRFDWGNMLGSERVDVSDGVGRVLAEPVYAAISSPGYHGSAMDGIAVRAKQTFAASDSHPLELAVGSEAVFVNTGEALPPGMDAVIMIERVQTLDDQRIRIEAPAFPWQHVRRVGEDIVATEMMFARHHVLRPTCVGALIAGGVLEVAVKRRPRVLVIPSGPELVDPRSKRLDELKPGEIIEFNSAILGAMVVENGGRFVRHPGVPDDQDLIAKTIADAVSGDYDAVLVIGGSSAGSHDFTRAAVASVGEVLVHGVTVMPGKPTVLGAVNERLVVGIPGYPVSAIVCFDQFVAPALAHMLGLPERLRQRTTAVVNRKIASKLGMEEFIRVRLGRVGERLVAAPLARGAGTVTSFAEADGLVRIGAELEGVNPFEPVTVELLRDPVELETNLVAVGSHDMCLDVLADLLRAGGRSATLSSTNVGSLGGLMAVRGGTCHLAGTHLLDPSDGSYNTAAIQRYLPDTPVRLVHLVRRQQGLMVAQGNPRNITGFEDLTRADVSFVNRQGGSGTRVLLDFELGRCGIDPGAIVGYDQIEFTHMAVAVAVQSGAADTGLGIGAAAKALGLDFIGVAWESYDLVIPEAHFDSPGIRALLAVIRSEAFAERVASLGGYDTSEAGEIR